MAQIPGISKFVQPNIFSRVRSRERVNAISGGARVVCVIGEGQSEETLVSSALGGGADGFNSDYSASNSPDGRHFKISRLDLVENRTEILKNGIPLVVLEEAIDSAVFDSRYDCRVDIATGRVELQRSYLIGVGAVAGDPVYYSISATNNGNGTMTITTESLEDTSAPAETWVARVVASVRNGSGLLVSGQATITLTGSVSGQLKDANGNPFTWKSDGVAVSNGVLNISFSDGSNPFDVGDKLTVKVGSGVLKKRDKLVAKYIATADLNDPEAFLSPSDLFAKHGNPSEDNNLSLGAQMAFENGAPVVLAVQARPSVPRRTSQTLIEADDLLTDAQEGATGAAAVRDTVFPLQLGSVPDVDSSVHLFIVSTDGTEEQLVLGKADFYNPAYTSSASAFSSFVLGPTSSSYTVFEGAQVEQQGTDGYVVALDSNTVRFQSDTAVFSSDHLLSLEGDQDKSFVVLAPAAFAGTYTIDTVGDGYGDLTTITATKSGAAYSINDTSAVVHWQIVDANDTSVYLAITDDVAIANLTLGKGLRVSIVDTKDADFFDTNWGEALEALEIADAQIVVPLPKATISNIFLATKAHVESMSDIINQKERIALVGAQRGLLPENVLGTALAAVEDIGLLEGIQGDDVEEVLESNIEDLADYSVTAAYGDSFRTVFMYPDEIIRNIAGQNTSLHGFYMAAALGGFLAGQSNVAEPATFKRLVGFNILRDRTFRQLTLDALGGAGILVVVPVAGGGKMLHGKTTVSSGAPEEEEISIVGIRDTIATAVRASLRPFIGKLNSPTLIPEITKGITKLMRSFVGSLLADVGAVSVSRNAVEPRQIDISIGVFVLGPINYIFVDMTAEL